MATEEHHTAALHVAEDVFGDLTRLGRASVTAVLSNDPCPQPSIEVRPANPSACPVTIVAMEKQIDLMLGPNETHARSTHQTRASACKSYATVSKGSRRAVTKKRSRPIGRARYSPVASSKGQSHTFTTAATSVSPASRRSTRTSFARFGGHSGTRAQASFLSYRTISCPNEPRTFVEEKARAHRQGGV
jgi:hypothetical protein